MNILVIKWRWSKRNWVVSPNQTAKKTTKKMLPLTLMKSWSKSNPLVNTNGLSWSWCFQQSWWQDQLWHHTRSQHMNKTTGNLMHFIPNYHNYVIICRNSSDAWFHNVRNYQRLHITKNLWIRPETGRVIIRISAKLSWLPLDPWIGRKILRR